MGSERLRRITFSLVAASTWLLHIPLQAQTPRKVARIGFVGQAKGTNLTDPNVIAFRQRLRDLGWVENDNLIIEWRFAEGAEERVPEIITDLVDRKVDVLVATGGNPVRIAKKATQTIPIVMTEHANPVLDGIVASLARPGGNITGMTSVRRELDGKRLELLKDVLPKLNYAGILWQATRTNFSIDIEHVEETARHLGVKLQSLGVRSLQDIEEAVQTIPRQSSGVIAVQSQLINSNKDRIAELMAKSRIPAVYPDRRYAFAGGLMSYGSNTEAVYAQAAGFVAKILKGASPSELPVEQPTKFELIINLKTAQQMSFTIPGAVLRWADEVVR